MEFELNDEQTLLRSGLREVLEGACDIDRVREVAYHGDGADPQLWQTLAEAGWPALTVPEADGGAGLGFEELMIAAVETGRTALYLPLWTTMLAARAIAGATSAARGEALTRIAEGRSSVTLALLGDPAEWNDLREGVAASSSGDGWALSGRHESVPFGPLADDCLVEVTLPGGGRGLALVPTATSGLAWTDRGTVDRAVRRFDVAFDGVQLPAGALLHGESDATAAVLDLYDELRAALAAETLGACERMLQMTVEYAKDREQFGRPIGSNQAVKVRIAQMAGTVERMTAAVYFAATQLAADSEERSLAVAMAKAATAAPGAFVATQAIHVHGAIAFTWEHDVQFFVKRAKSNELLFGDTPTSLARVADAVV